MIKTVVLSVGDVYHLGRGRDHIEYSGTTLTEARVLIEQWRREYNQVRPHSSLGYRPPAPEATMPVTLT